MRDEKSSGINGGSFSSGSWLPRTLNTTVTNQIGASLGANQITLSAGTYFISARAPANFVSNHQVKLRNITDGADTITGSTANAVGTQTDSFLTGQFTIAGSKVFEFQHRCQNTTTADGLGNACGFGNTEVYAEVLIWKLL